MSLSNSCTYASIQRLARETKPYPRSKSNRSWTSRLLKSMLRPRMKLEATKKTTLSPKQLWWTLTTLRDTPFPTELGCRNGTKWA
jgi:hypothetical protein